MAAYHFGLRSQLRKASPALIGKTVRGTSNSTLLVDWVNRGPAAKNWGDLIAPRIAEWISGKTVVAYRDVWNVANREVYTTIGSMLGTIRARRTIVWGSGFVDSRASLQTDLARVCAVRGPLTFAKLRAAGVDCPEVFGDPALLYPMIYRPTSTPRYDLGIIPHFKEKDLPAVRALADAGNVSIIDIEAGEFAVAEAIAECRAIASSSLHGLVLADGYGVPANWIRMSQRPAGDGFKFRDYLLSTNSGREHALDVDASTSHEQLLDHVGAPTIDLDLDAFIESCPFRNREVSELRGTAMARRQ